MKVIGSKCKKGEWREEKNTYSSHRDKNFHKQASKCMLYVFIFYFQEVLGTFLCDEELKKGFEKRRKTQKYRTINITHSNTPTTNFENSWCYFL